MFWQVGNVKVELRSRGRAKGSCPSEGEMVMIDTDMNSEWPCSVKTMIQPSPSEKMNSKQYSEENREWFASLNMSHILPNKKGS